MSARSAITVKRTGPVIFVCLCLSAWSGCSSITSSRTGRMSESLATSILNQNDPETVRQGAPAYLLMIDGFIADDPEDPETELL